MAVKTGRYEHFKGNIYRVVANAIHTETDEPLVIYRDSEGRTFARPERMFTETIQKGERTIPRFAYLGR